MIAAITAIVGTVAKIADMSDACQARLFSWGAHLRNWGIWAFLLIGIVNGVVGTVLFFLSDEPVTRTAIGSLLILILSASMTFNFAVEKLVEKRRERLARTESLVAKTAGL